jgi:thioredoxin 1
MGNFYVTQVTDRNFPSIVGSCDTPILLHFGACWCPPCEILQPTIEALATEYKGRVMVGVVDTDENVDTAMKFAVWVKPTVLVLYRGRLIRRFQGIRDKLEFRRFLDSLLVTLKTPANHQRRTGRFLLTSQLN